MSADSSDQRPTEPATEPDENANGTDRQDVELADLRDRWQRALADLDNLRKRQIKELAQALAAERSAVAGAWLPVLDNLERALAHADADPDAIVTGVRAVRDQAVELLARLGYPRQDETVGVPFDPVRHEVVTVVDEPSATPGTVVQVLRPGYGEADRQLRPQAVAVSRQAE
jgi:molecular chaperone GrpE